MSTTSAIQDACEMRGTLYKTGLHTEPYFLLTIPAGMPIAIDDTTAAIIITAKR